MFKLLKKKELPGSSLLADLPGLTCDKVAKKFGEAAAMRDQTKSYSGVLVFKMNGNPVYYTLYMRDGEWRVGGDSRIITRAYLGTFVKFITS